MLAAIRAGLPAGDWREWPAVLFDGVVAVARAEKPAKEFQRMEDDLVKQVMGER